MKTYNKEILIKGIEAYRDGCYKGDIERSGDDYWKSKLLEDFGSLCNNGVEWVDIYPENHPSVIAFDENCPSIIELARI